MKTLKISSDLSLPLDWITLATVIYGARGSGKTSLGRVLAEEATKAGLRFCAIDLKGDWWGLKSSADGKRDGIPIVVFGGDHQDVPLEDGAGAFVGETVAGLEQSCVLDLEHFSKGKQVRFLTEFFSKLYDANRDPLLLLLDEAQRYAPQGRMVDPDSAKCLGAVEDLVKLGRKHGIGPVLFTQRGSGLNKEVSELCDLLVAFRTPGPLDQERVKDWLDANTTKVQRDQVMSQLSGLATGTAVFASGHPELKIFGVHGVRRSETFDSSATPKVGQRRVEPKQLATPDLEVLRSRMSAAIERAKADDPKALRRRIAELEKALAAKPAAAPPSAPKVVEVSVLTDEDRAILRELGAPMRQLIEASSSLFDRLNQWDHVREKVLFHKNIAPPSQQRQPDLRQSPALNGAPKETLRTKTARPSTSSNAPIGGGLRRILVALAQRPQGLTNRQIGVRAGLSSRSGTFSTYVSRARQSGWVEGSGTVRITDHGVSALGEYDPLPTGSALADYWLGELGGGAARMLRALIDVFPKGLDNEALGVRAEISHRSGTFSTYVSRLRSLELVSGRGELFASEELFS